MGLTRCYKTTVFYSYICSFYSKFILQSERSRRSNCVTVPNFVKISRTSGRDMAIFRFFKMAAAAISHFCNYKFLTVGRVMSVELRHHAKFCSDRPNRCRDIAVIGFGTVQKVELRRCAKFRRHCSNRGGDMAKFRFFKMAAAAILYF